jgi:hypothetical protein
VHIPCIVPPAHELHITRALSVPSFAAQLHIFLAHIKRYSRNKTYVPPCGVGGKLPTTATDYTILTYQFDSSIPRCFFSPHDLFLCGRRRRLRNLALPPYSGHHWRRSGEVMAGMDRPNDAGQDEPRFEPQVSCILSSPNSQIPNLPACSSAPTPVSRVGLPNPTAASGQCTGQHQPCHAQLEPLSAGCRWPWPSTGRPGPPKAGCRWFLTKIFVYMVLCIELIMIIIFYIILKLTKNNQLHMVRTHQNINQTSYMGILDLSQSNLTFLELELDCEPPSFI